MTREDLGRLVRETWMLKARTHPHPKPSWLVPWDELDDFQREVDCLIGEVVAAAERERCAQLAEQSMAVYLKPGPVRFQGQEHTHDWQPFADLLRERP